MPPVHPAPGIPGPATSIAPATSAGPRPSIVPGYSRPIVHISAKELHNLLTYLYIITTIPKL